MNMADYIEANRDRVIDGWKVKVKARAPIKATESQLINSLPLVMEEIVYTLRHGENEWPSLHSAVEHGRQRVELGVDISALTEEMAFLGEAAVELASQDGFELDSRDVQLLFRVVGRATAVSVHAYANMRDQQLADEAARHFSFVAHEIRNPLNNTRLALELISLAPERDRDQHLHRLDGALRQLSEQVDNSMVGARLYGQPDLELQTHDAADLVEAALDDVALHAKKREIAVIPELEHFQIQADRKLVVSALTNLLSNAVKFSQVGGQVRVKARVQDDRALFEVEDECGGLPESLSQSVFEPFMQTSKDRSGFGLGLTIVKQAVEAHQGFVRVGNHPGNGCCFVVDLPRYQAKGEA